MTEKQRQKPARSGQTATSSPMPPAAPDATCGQPRSCAGGDGEAKPPGPQHRYRPAVAAPVSPFPLSPFPLSLLLLCPLPSPGRCSPRSRTPRYRARSGFRGGKRRELLLPRPRRQVSPGPQKSGSRASSAPRSLAPPSSRAFRTSRSRPAASGPAAMRRSEPLRRRRPPSPWPPRRLRRGPIAGPPAPHTRPPPPPHRATAAQRGTHGPALPPDPMPRGRNPPRGCRRPRSVSAARRATCRQVCGELFFREPRGEAGRRSRSGGRARPGPPAGGPRGPGAAPERRAVRA